jgi:hypothetical protein
MPETSSKLAMIRTSNYLKKFRALVEGRMKEKGISLAGAMVELEKEGAFDEINKAGVLAVEKLHREREGVKGWARESFARKVQDELKIVLSANPRLSPRDAFLRASEAVAERSPQSLADYRHDVREM